MRRLAEPERWNRPARGDFRMVAEAEPETAEPAAPKKLNRLVIIGAGAALAVLLAAGAVFFFLPKPAAELAATDGAPHSFIFNLPTMTVNLNSEGGSEQFLRLTVALEVADQQVMTDIQPRLAKVLDTFQVYLRELRKSDLEGSAGIYRLKDELLRRVNVAIYPSEVESILFRDILVQ
jgi:flagellar FliL protein